MNDPERDGLLTGAAQLGVPLSRTQIEQFALYADLLAEWNQRMNLTRVRAEDVVPLHFLDSLATARAVDVAAARSLLDVGTGAGFPGLPLKIAFPHLEVALLDSTRKRLTFLDAVIQTLGLTGVRTLHARAEEAARLPDHRERYDLVTARAVARLEVLAEWLLPLVRVGGSAVALKSEQIADELASGEPAVVRLGGRVARVAEIQLPGTDITRRIVVARKVQRTPARYPRPAAETANAAPPRVGQTARAGG